jgi:chromosome segregation ATPase
VDRGRSAAVREIKDQMNAATAKIAELDKAAPPPGQERITHNVEREKAAATVKELEQRLEFAGHDDASLAEKLEETQIRAAELKDEITKYGESDPRGRKAARQLKEDVRWRAAEIEVELNKRTETASLKKLRDRTLDRAATREAEAEWNKIAKQRLAEAALDVQRGAEPWTFEKAKAEVKEIPPDLIARKRAEITARG